MFVNIGTYSKHQPPVRKFCPPGTIAISCSTSTAVVCLHYLSGDPETAMAATGNTLIALLGPKLVGKTASGETVELPTAEALKGKHIALYFSAHWCPPCRAFTPVLRKAYLLCLAKGISLQVVFVSSDRTLAEFKDYYMNNMPWLAVPFENEAARQALSRKVGVSGIPTLCIIDPDGKVVNGNARAALVKDPECKSFPWAGQEEGANAASITPFLALALILALYWMWSR